MSANPVIGHPSTHGDHYQLNTTNLIRQAARTYPEQEIVFRATDGQWDRYTYADAWLRIQRAANALRSLGVGPGDVVGVLDWNSKRFFELYWAIPGLGAVLLQLNVRLGETDLTFVAEHSEASVVLVDETLLPLAESIAENLPAVKTWVVMSDRPVATSLPGAVSLEELMAAADDAIDWPVIDERSAYGACYTTGTTGRPKGVYYSHRGMVLHTFGMVGALGIDSADAVMLITPMFHANCWGFPQAAVMASAKVVLPGRYSADDTSLLVDAMVAEGVSVANGAPAIFQPMMDYIKTMPVKPDLRGARLISGATEPALSLMRDFHDLTGADVIHAYGATETTPIATLNGAVKPSLRDTLSEEERWDLKRCQGMPVSGVDVKVVDSLGRELPRDGESQGEIWLRGPWVTEGYWRVEDDGTRFTDGWWRTGDVGRLDAHGYLKLTDRLKDVVKSGGEWISSIDMENAIIAHPLIREAAVIGVNHPKWQERPVAVVVPVDGATVTLQDVLSVLKDGFSSWQLPDLLHVVDELPRTSVGKLDKKVMRARYANDYRTAE